MMEVCISICEEYYVYLILAFNDINDIPYKVKPPKSDYILENKN